MEHFLKTELLCWNIGALTQMRRVKIQIFSSSRKCFMFYRLNAKPPFRSWWRSAFNEVNDCVLWEGKAPRGSKSQERGPCITISKNEKQKKLVPTYLGFLIPKIWQILKWTFHRAQILKLWGVLSKIFKKIFCCHGTTAATEVTYFSAHFRGHGSTMSTELPSPRKLQTLLPSPR